MIDVNSHLNFILCFNCLSLNSNLVYNVNNYPITPQRVHLLVDFCAWIFNRDKDCAPPLVEGPACGCCCLNAPKSMLAKSWLED